MSSVPETPLSFDAPPHGAHAPDDEGRARAETENAHPSDTDVPTIPDTGGQAPALMLLRGNSASGKSTIARRIQHALAPDRVAVIGQDQIRREMLWEKNGPDAATIGVVELLAHHLLDLGRITIIEGIYKECDYGEMFRRLLASHTGPSLVYYLDVSFEETMRRHAGKPIADVVSRDEMAAWYRESDLLGVPGEQVLEQARSEDELVQTLLRDLGAAGAAGAQR